MINQIMKLSVKKLKIFSTMLLLKLYNELGFEYLKFRRWLRKLYLFYKIKKNGLPKCLFNIIPQSNRQYNTRSTKGATTFYCRTDIFKYSYFP